VHFSVELPTQRVAGGDEFVSQSAVAEVARCAEAAGFDAVFVTDHPFPHDPWLAAGGHHALDPFVALSFAAASTTDLRLQTHILVLPYRNPFHTAKSVVSLDVLSGGRLILGVAAGYLRAEFAALGADFENRNDVCDEAIRAMVAAWTSEGVEIDGAGFAARGHTMLPLPAQRPHPPIWVGGNSRRAIRRAVELGDGWIPFPNTPGMAKYTRTAVLTTRDELAGGIRYAREHAQKVGRTAPLTVSYSLTGFGRSSNDEILAAIEDLRSLGVSWLTVGVPGASRRDYCANLEHFGSEIIPTARRP
jgi:probable F420-dependent oxidoreductase